ncbi:MAG: glycosyltransferase [Candidatus Bathyarchaeia archaeon]
MTVDEDRELLIIIPAYDEPKGLRMVMEEILETIDPLILVVNRPPGHIQGKIAEGLGATVLDQQSKGKGLALREALEYIEKKYSSPEYFALIDADYTYPANYINEMIEILRENPKVGMVTGNRFPSWINRMRDVFKALPNPYYVGNRILAIFHRLLNNVNMSDPFTGLRVIRYPLIRSWRPKSRGFDIECELNDFILNKEGYEVVEIPIEFRRRVGKKKLGLRHGFIILLRIFNMAINRLRERT